MSSEEGNNRTGASHRPYDEAFKRAAVAQWQSGVPASRVAQGLDITTESLRTWRRQFAETQADPVPAAAGKLPAVAPTSQELQAEVCRLRAQLQSITNQRDILKKAVGIFAGPNGSVSPLIEAMEDAYPVSDLCAALDVSRAGFYAWRQRGPSERDRADATLGEQIGTLFARRRRTYGSPRLHRALRRSGHALGRHRVARLMRGRAWLVACGDAAEMESFWSTLKEELVHRTHFASRAQAASAIFDCIETFYNRERLHSALGFISPVEFEKQTNLN